MTSQPENLCVETIHNFNAVNNQIGLELEKQKEQLKLERSALWQRAAIIFAIVIISSSTAYLIYAFSIYLTKTPQTNSSTIKYISNSLPDQLSDTSHINNTVTVDFTVFRTEATQDGRSVVTGYNYSPDQVDFPLNQYCYISEKLTANNSTRVDLAYVNENDPPVWNTEISAINSDLARILCKFISR